jgi:hypothetical protein
MKNEQKFNITLKIILYEIIDNENIKKISLACSLEIYLVPRETKEFTNSRQDMVNITDNSI